MKIAIMMRAIDQDSGFRKVAEDLVENMLRLDSRNSYVLIYRMPKHYGRFASYSNAKEVLTSSVHKLLWDQIIVPWVALKEGADIIFNPKFSVPLLSPIPVTMGLQEFGFFTNPEYYTKWDVRYQKFMIPRCVRKSIHLFPNSNFILEENRRILGLPLQNTTVLYSASDNRFRPIEGGEELLKFKNRYNLPEKFIACLTRVDHPGLEGEDSFYGGKNPEIVYRAYLKIRDKIPHKLLFAGRRVKEYLYHTEGNNLDLAGVEFISFIPYDELHFLYNAADFFVNAAPREGCPNTVLEAMACGKAMVLASTGGSADVAADAALFCEPRNAEEFSKNMLSVCLNQSVKRDLESKSLKRSEFFRWEKTAKLCIEALDKCVDKGK